MKVFKGCCWILLVVVPCFARNLDVIIFGGRGDLAKRYLWNGFFRLFQNNMEKGITFYGAGLSEIKQSHFQKIVMDSIHCDQAFHDNCYSDVNNFLNRTRYLQMKTDHQFEEFCISVNVSPHDILFYLSVPPSAYKSIIRSIALYCNTKSKDRSYKFVFEKPFGEDLESALTLSSILNEHLEEDQIFRVDHYLGKETTQEILNFRKKNPEIERIFDAKYVEKIEIIVSETIGCEGRTSYYDKSGVIRDMLQSHLTEVLCLMTMPLDGMENKLGLLQNISTVHNDSVFVGQYKGYIEELHLETGMKKSVTPTFAAARVYINSTRWKRVSIQLISGKHLSERVGYGRIVFRRKYFPGKSECAPANPQIVFVMQHDKLTFPAIFVSRELPFNSTYIPDNWVVTTLLDNLKIFGTTGKCFRIFRPKRKVGAYEFLIQKIYESKRGHFVPLHHLLQSWKIWTSIVIKSQNALQIMQYNIGSTISRILLNRICQKWQCCILNILLQKCD